MNVRAFFRLGRVSNLPTVWSNTLAGLLLAGGSLDGKIVVPLLVSMTLFYTAGMFLNDAFDRNFDARERPDRPIPSGAARPGAVFTTGFSLLGLALAALLLPARQRGWAPILSGTLLALAIVYYDARHKGNPLSPLIMGLCRVLVYITAALTVAPSVPGTVQSGAFVLLSYLIGLTYLAKQEDLREVNHVWPLGFLAVPFVYGFRVFWVVPEGMMFYATLLICVLYATFLLFIKGKGDVPRAVAVLIAGISLLDGLLIAGMGQRGPAVVAALGFPLTLFLQRYVKGT